MVILDTQRIIVDPGAGEPLENVQWSDTIPKLLQEKIIQSFEASNYVGAVAKPMEGLAADYQLLIDLRSFQITGTPAAPTAHVEFAAKILGEGRTDRRVANLRRGRPGQGHQRRGGGRRAQ